MRTNTCNYHTIYTQKPITMYTSANKAQDRRDKKNEQIHYRM